MFSGIANRAKYTWYYGVKTATVATGLKWKASVSMDLRSMPREFPWFLSLILQKSPVALVCQTSSLRMQFLSIIFLPAYKVR